MIVEFKPFIGGLHEQDEKGSIGDSDTIRQTDSPKTRLAKEDDDLTGQTVRQQKARAAFGGLIREWYLMAREYALGHKEPGQKYITRSNIIHGMVVCMISDQVIVSGGRNVKTIAYIPNKKVNHFSNGDRRIIVGLYQRVRESNENPEECYLDITGLNATWSITIPKQIVPKLPPHMKQDFLIAIQARRTNREWRLTHTPFAVQLSQPDAMWVESNVEADAYEILIRHGCKVDKPLRIREDLGGLRPDFVINGFDLPVIVEIYGRVNDPEYNAHKEVKRGMYRALEREGLIRYIEWDAEEKNGRERFVMQVESLNRHLRS